jgi:hypothetical protein
VLLVDVKYTEIGVRISSRVARTGILNKQVSVGVAWLAQLLVVLSNVCIAFWSAQFPFPIQMTVDKRPVFCQKDWLGRRTIVLTGQGLFSASDSAINCIYNSTSGPRAQSVQCLTTDWAAGVRSPTEAEDFSSNLCVQTGSGAHWASYTMGTGGSFPGGKARPGRDADHSPPSSAEVKKE